MLGLLTPTPSTWIDAALSNLDAVLLDHLHCELKAASNATALVTRYPMYARLVRSLSELAREELTHVQQVFDELERRGVRARPPGEDPYALALRRASQPDTPRAEHGALLDRLSIGALIEARSCERFKILERHAPTAELRSWYGALFASEARHYRLFASLAEDVGGEELARRRLAQLAEREAEIVERLPLEPRVH
jgi:tRNA-(ms[2]io[6]A)-hydroxylase